MGTGKSIQALVAIALAHFGCRSRFNRTSDTSEKADQHFPLRSMIICPSTLVGHWDGEIAKFFPPRTIFTSLCLTGTRSDRIEKWIHKSVDVNIVIASYDVLRSDIDYLDGEEWCYCVLDEGHLLKNPKTGKHSDHLGASSFIFETQPLTFPYCSHCFSLEATKSATQISFDRDTYPKPDSRTLGDF